MPHVAVDGRQIWYTDQGEGAAVVLLHSLYFDGRMFDHQAQALAGSFRVIVPDVRDHGRSDASPGPWTLEDAVDDLFALQEALDLGPIHLAGLSMGGMIAMRAALREPERVASLVLMDTNAGGEERRRLHLALARFVRLTGRLGMRLVMPYVTSQMFSPGFRDRPEARRWAEWVQGQEVEAIYRASRAVFDREDVLDRLAAVELPTLVVVAEKDAATPPRCSEAIANAIEGAELVRIPEAGHVSSVEQPEAVTEALDAFLAGVSR